MVSLIRLSYIVAKIRRKHEMMKRLSVSIVENKKMTFLFFLKKRLNLHGIINKQKENE